MRKKPFFLLLLVLFLNRVFAFPTHQELSKMDVYTLLDYADFAARNSIDSAFYINDIALSKGNQAKDWLAVFYTQRERGLYFEKYNKPSEAIAEYEKALIVLDQLPNRNEYISIAFTDLAIAYRKNGNYASSKLYHDRALEIALLLKNKELEEDSYHGLGLLYETVGEWEKAIAYYQKSVGVAESRKNNDGVIVSFQNIANVLSKSNHGEMAIEKIMDAWNMAQQSDSIRRAHVLNDFGEILVKMKRFDEALEKFNTSFKIYKAMNDQPMIGRALHNLASVYAQKGNTDKAIMYFGESLSLRSSIRPEDLVKLYFDLAQLYRSVQKDESAHTTLQSCLQVAEQYNLREYIQKAHFALFQLAEKKGDQNDALAHLKIARAMEDLLSDQEKERRIEEMEFRFQAEKTELLISDLKSQNWKMGLGALAFALTLILFFVLYLYRQQERHNAQLNLKNALIEAKNQRLKESNEVLKQFAYATAHDLKEPLRTIGSFIGLLQHKFKSSFNEEGTEYLELVKGGAMRMNNLLTDLLEYSTLFMDTPEKGKCDFFEVMNEVTGNLRETIRLRNARIEMPLEIPMPPLHIKKTHLVQLIQNLISNGIKFSLDQPVVKVAVTVEKDENVLITVRDNGIGISKNYQDKVFQIFQRLDRKRFEGDGIGLAICKNVVEKYGGKIWFESEEGVGTTFFVRMPVMVESAVPSYIEN